MRELRGVEELTVMPEESPVGVSAANAVIGKKRVGDAEHDKGACFER